MAWEKRLRQISWVFFLIMWVPLGVMIYTSVTDGDEEIIEYALIPFFILCMLFAIVLVGSFGVGWLERENIKKKGIPAKATILSLSDTGTTVNDQPLMQIELEVQPPYDSRFTTTVEYVVPFSFLMQLQPGTVVKVYYLEETKEVALADL